MVSMPSVENNINIQETQNMQFNAKSIIDYLKAELEKLKLDDAEITSNKDKTNIEADKLNYFKEKYNIEIPKVIQSDVGKQVSTENKLKIEDDIFEHLKLLVSDDKNMICTNLIYIITQLMKFVENFNLEGVNKKTIIIESIKKFLTYENMFSEEIDIILNKVCPELIDILLLVDKRKIIIRKKLNCFIPWCF